MEVESWLTINDRGTARITKSKPTTTRWDEVSIRLNINLPDALFTRPRLEASIEISEEAVGPEVINSIVIENVKEAIEQKTGLEFQINVIRNEEQNVN